MRAPSQLPRSEPPRAGARDAGDGRRTSDDPRDDFAAFVRAEFVWVWRLLRRIGLSPADADDATQQVFLVAARRSGEVRGGSARAFLYGTAVRVAANVRRSLRRRGEVPSEAAGEVSAHDLPTDELVEQRRARALLDALLAKLPPDLRRVLVLAEIEQLGVQQIADLEAVPLGTAASRLRRARAVFFELLERERVAQPGKHEP